MRLNQESVNKIVNGATDMVVYGLESCQYIAMSDALSLLNFKTHTAQNYRLPQSIPLFLNREYSPDNIKLIIGDECKHIIVNLLLENYRRVRERKPIIPLLFCLGIEDDLLQEEVNLDLLFKNSSLIANKELRRCYRLYAETTPAIQVIARYTFKFVRLLQNPLDREEYFLEQMCPFWEEEGFEQKWQARLSDPDRPSQVRARIHPKQHKWKDELLVAIRLFDQSKAAKDVFFSESQPVLRSRL